MKSGIAMDIDSPYELTTSRACDRCHSLKTQCLFGNPCGRCQRLGLTCTNDRPQRARGRPPKGTSRSRSSHTLQLSPEDSSSVSPRSGLLSTETFPFFQGLPEISVPHDVLASLVQQLLNSAPGLGLYSIIPACANLQLRHDGSSKQVLEDMLQPEVRCALAAIALELYGHNVPGYTQKKATVDRDILHKSALSSIPNIASRKNQPTLSNALCLLMLSHTWTIAEDFKKIPMQWCSVARIIFDNCEKEDQRTSLYSRELERRTNIALSLQECVLLIVNNCVKIWPHFHHSTATLPFITDEEWHSPSRSSDFEQNNTPHSHPFFALFQPFISIMKNIAQEPEIGSPHWIEIEEQLEDYFFRFPEALLQFSNISHCYQFEAMIWLHGLFIVLYSTRDFINLLKKTIYLQVDCFTHILEHSLLLGEAITPLLSKNPDLESLTPTTIYLLCISSAVHSLALRQFIFQPDFAHISPPAKLIKSTQDHLEILRVCENKYKRCDPLIIRELLQLLSTCLQAAIGGSMTGVENLSCARLYLYRWTGEGSGMIQMNEKDADREWKYVEPPSDKLWDGLTGLETKLAVAILQVCDPAQRVCGSGFFDLSIMIPM